MIVVAPIFAHCPACDVRRRLDQVPASGAQWPICDGCATMMAVYAPSSIYRSPSPRPEAVKPSAVAEGS
jgi:hypothetical protein